MSDTYKYDDGKPRLSLVPQQIVADIARVREYGVDKYGDKDNWRKVSIDRYLDAALRHMSAMVSNGVDAVDEESGLPHYAHAACNLAFIAELMKAQEVDTEKPAEKQKSTIRFVTNAEEARQYCEVAKQYYISLNTLDLPLDER
jgi:hypothetical protein